MVYTVFQKLSLPYTSINFLFASLKLLTNINKCLLKPASEFSSLWLFDILSLDAGKTHKNLLVTGRLPVWFYRPIYTIHVNHSSIHLVTQSLSCDFLTVQHMREQTAAAINGNGEPSAAELKPAQAVLPPVKISDPAPETGLPEPTPIDLEDMDTLLWWTPVKCGASWKIFFFGWTFARISVENFATRTELTLDPKNLRKVFLSFFLFFDS